MPEIAGYTNMKYVKGQYYRYAASPKPVTFSGNIDDPSNDALIVKAMFVVKGSASGTFPDFGNNFLITTVQYAQQGNVYLQTAYLVEEGFECYEFRRIYSNGEWTAWIGVDSKIDAVDNKIDGVKNVAENNSMAIGSIGSTVTNLGSSVSGLNNTVGLLSGQVSTISSKVTAIDTRTTNCGKAPLNLWHGTLTVSDPEIKLQSCYNRHSQFLIVAKVQNASDASLVTQSLVKSQLTTSNTKYCISDEVWWLSYIIRYSGDDLYVKCYGQNKNGFITDIWGIY